MIVWTLFIDGIFSHHKRPRPFNQRLWEMNVAILGIGLSVAAAVTITGALKNLLGKPRPDVLARCQLPKDYVQLPVGLTSWEKCTGDPILLKDGFKSWPSGHSSVAFSGLGYFSIWLAGKLHIMDNRGEVWKTMIVLTPILGAGMIAISRIMDARHHPFDVLSSSILGMFLAWVAYRQYFPSIYDTSNKGRAYSIRKDWPGNPASEDRFRPTPVDEEARVGSTRGSASGAPVVAEVGGLYEQRRRSDPLQPSLPVGSHEHGYNFDDTYEMNDQKTRLTGTPYKPHSDNSPPHRPDTRASDDSNHSDDHRWGIAAATSALGGQKLASTPTPQEYKNPNSKAQ